MRRSVTLYIDGRRADLDTASLILFSWSAGDLASPAAVRNSYSKTVALPGTPANDAIMEDAFRLDRTSGASFQPSARTPFVIFADGGEVLESGYLKLDGVERNGSGHTYNVTLYGGLGSYLYALSFREDGNRMTLADLDYVDGLGGPSELDFDIDATSVSAAWTRLLGVSPDFTNPWDVINFAPAYNGIPADDFDAQHAIADPAELGLTLPTGYQAKGGKVLVSFAQPVDEWAAKDLRSYLQRPVLSCEALMRAVSNPDLNGGYTVDWSDVLADVQNVWQTLPMISSLKSRTAQVGDRTITPQLGTQTAGDVAQRYDITPALNVGDIADISLSVRLKFAVGGAWPSKLGLSERDQRPDTSHHAANVAAIFLQAVAYNSADIAVGASQVLCVSDLTAKASKIARMCKYSPVYTLDGDDYVAPVKRGVRFTRVGTTATADDDLTLTLKAPDVAYIKLHISSYKGLGTADTGAGTLVAHTMSAAAQPLRPALLDATGGVFVSGNFYQTGGTTVETGVTGDTISVQEGGILRSGARITKAMLLTGERTPADYIVSLGKTFGWMWLFDAQERKVTILRRNSFYRAETLDLTDRVDLSQPVKVTPYAYTAKWYDWKVEMVRSAFAELYASGYGRPYGLQRVNTGYDWADTPVDVMGGIAYKGAVTMSDYGRYWNIVKDGGQFVPSPFLDPGCKFTCWKTSDGTSKEVEIATPSSSAVLDYYNQTHNGYDIETARKCEFRDKDGKAVDGEDVLLLFEGQDHYDAFALTDDDPLMDVLNGGKPCWSIGDTSALTLAVPTFGRYTYRSGGFRVDRSLDFGVPAELAAPDIVYNAADSLYARKWGDYIADRYDDDTKVMRCKVHLDGLRPGPDLLRRFYWYGGSLWVLNAVSDYSVTTDDPAECEFVQVRDMDNYLNGQQ